MGDLLFTTDNEVLMRRQENLPALRCIQHKAKKEIVTEESIINSHIASFGSKIGQITNRCSSMTSLMAKYSEDSKEYQTLKYRTQCMQAVQQAEIDKAKGIKTYPMQKSWYMLNECQQKDEYTDEYNAKMAFYEEICAHKKPYYFGYVYSGLMKEYRETTNRAKTNARQKFKMELEDMIAMYENGEEISLNHKIFVERFYRSLRLDRAESTCNMICWEIERIFDNQKCFAPQKSSLYDMVRSDYETSPNLLDKIAKMCKASERKRAVKCIIEYLIDDGEVDAEYQNVDYDLSDVLYEVCNNEEQLCDLLLDYCYKYNGNKEILWSVCGETIVKRLMKDNQMYYPMLDPNGCFEVQGRTYSMVPYIQGGVEDEECYEI